MIRSAVLIRPPLSAQWWACCALGLKFNEAKEPAANLPPSVIGCEFASSGPFLGYIALNSPVRLSLYGISGVVRSAT